MTLTREEIKEYAMNLIANGCEVINAVKNTCILAKQGIVGEKVDSWTSNENGPFIERSTTISLDDKTEEPGWIVTKIDDKNNIVVDKYGNINQYVIVDSVFKSMYEEVTPGLYRKNNQEKFICVDENISFETKYGEMSVTSGGYLKVTDLDKISGIQAVDFDSTYEVINTEEKKI